MSQSMVLPGTSCKRRFLKYFLHIILKIGSLKENESFHFVNILMLTSCVVFAICVYSKI